MAKRYYIAYGSNLNIPQMRWRCPSARIIGKSEIPDYRLLFKGSQTGAYLTIEPSQGDSVPVGVWEMNWPWTTTKVTLNSTTRLKWNCPSRGSGAAGQG